MTDTSKPIVVTMGDPNGIGPEVLVRSLPDLSSPQRDRVTVVGDSAYLKCLARDLSLGELPPLHFIEAGAVSYPPPWGTVTREAGEFAVACLERGMGEVRRQPGSVLVTAPIHKEAVGMAGFRYPGQTEFIASYFPDRTAVMAFFSSSLKVALVTVHVPLREVPACLTTDGIRSCGLLLFETLRKCGVESPRIAVAGLNPHASESGLFGSEEAEIVEPALELLQASTGHRNFSGPFPPDSLFHRAASGEFDGVVALYHDQGLIPVKLLAFHSAVNVTLGLPVVRTSPCHGTAFDIAGRGCADPSSMREAFRWAIRLGRGAADGLETEEPAAR